MTATQPNPLQTIVVTGSAGIVGSGIASVIESDLMDALARDNAPGSIMLVRASRRTGYDLTGGDLDHTPADVIIHCAATPYHQTQDAFKTMANDIECTLWALRTGSRSRGRTRRPHFILLSSSLVYENALGVEWEDPKQPVRTIPEEDTQHCAPATDPIGVAKLLSEQAVKTWARETGGTYTIWRLANVISPAERHDVHGHVVVNLYRKLFVDRLDEIEVSDHIIRSYTWIDDVSNAVVGFMHDTRAQNQIFNLGASEAVSIAELAERMIAIGKRLKLLPTEYSPLRRLASHSKQARVMDTSRVKETLGWEAKTSLDSALEQFIAHKTARCRVHDAGCINPTFCYPRSACCVGDPACRPEAVAP